MKYQIKNGRNICGLFNPLLHPRLLLYILTVMLLSCLDAIFTIYLLNLGAAEINPVMAFFLSFGPAVFMLVKYVLTFLCVLVILLGAAHMSDKKNQLVDRLFCFLVCAFGIVIFWELYLILFVLR